VPVSADGLVDEPHVLAFPVVDCPMAATAGTPGVVFDAAGCGVAAADDVGCVERAFGVSAPFAAASGADDAGEQQVALARVALPASDTHAGTTGNSSSRTPCANTASSSDMFFADCGRPLSASFARNSCFCGADRPRFTTALPRASTAGPGLGSAAR